MISNYNNKVLFHYSLFFALSMKARPTSVISEFLNFGNHHCPQRLVPLAHRKVRDSVVSITLKMALTFFIESESVFKNI